MYRWEIRKGEGGALPSKMVKIIIRKPEYNLF